MTQAVAELASGDETVASLLWPELEAQMDIVETHKASEILFDGWDMPDEYNFDFSAFSALPLGNISTALNYTQLLTGSLHDILENLGDAVPGLGDKLIDILPMLEPNKISFFYGVGNSLYITLT